jgi:hypothetical protein
VEKAIPRRLLMVPATYSVFVQTAPPGNVPPFTFGVRVTPQGGGMITLPINSESEFNAVLALLQTPGQLFFDRGALIKNG